MGGAFGQAMTNDQPLSVESWRFRPAEPLDSRPRWRANDFAYANYVVWSGKLAYDRPGREATG